MTKEMKETTEKSQMRNKEQMKTVENEWNYNMNKKRVTGSNRIKEQKQETKDQEKWSKTKKQKKIPKEYERNKKHV